MRSRVGPVRDRFLAALRTPGLPDVRISNAIGDDALFGGLDVAETLAAGRPVVKRGLLAEPKALTLPMAESCPAPLAARLAHALDDGGHCLIAMDEGAEVDEALPSVLAERLGLFLSLDGIALGDAPPRAPLDVTQAQATLPTVKSSDQDLEALTLAAAELGIASLRVPVLALKAAKASAALAGRTVVAPEDLETAVSLVYAHRAQPLAELPDEPANDDTQPEAQNTDKDDGDLSALDMPPEEMLVEAARAALPPDLLARLAAQRAARATKGADGAGAARKGNRRGRPLPARPGRLDGQSKIDLIATLRAAAPWQRIRRAAQPDDPRHLLIRPSDIRVRRFQERSDRLVVFAVDASGSAAMARLAEAKGAVETLLAQAYASRDHVALVSFRGDTAEVLLPPTRSLVQTKRRLTAMPGGGGTPLAAGMRAALEVAQLGQARGMAPAIALLTDGKANIALDGSANKAQAAEDAERMAKFIRGEGLPSVVIDTGRRPRPALAELAANLDAPYVPLPHAQAEHLASVVGDAIRA